MAILIDCQNLEKSFGAKHLFSALSFSLAEGERVGLIGQNGSGKSTLLKIISGQIEPDDGNVVRKTHLKMSYVSQSEDFNDRQTIEEVLHQAAIDQQVEDAELRVAKLASRMQLGDLSRRVADLSGGWRKRVAIVSALLCDPELLLLDEPTNHLDIDSVLWLEGVLKNASFAWLVVTHDRQFLENTVTKVGEIHAAYDSGVYFSHGGYEAFLKHKAEYFETLQSSVSSLSNKMRTEDAWLQRGPKARTTKARARIDNAEQLRKQLSDLKKKVSEDQLEFNFSSSGRKTKKLSELKDVRYEYANGPSYGPLFLTVTNGLRLGVLGRNGSGKTTLMKLLMGELLPKEGTIREADSLRKVYFDQKRETVDENQSLKEALSQGNDQVILPDRSIHVVSWAKKFRFTTDQLSHPVSKLSGGEKAKVILANLMTLAADLLFLDEPTNDLDIQSLELLEESLEEFVGAVVLISHDRYFLESVCNTFVGFDSDGQLQVYNDFQHWLKENGSVEQKEAKEKVSSKPRKKSKPRKLSYMDQRDYDSIEDRIAEKEAEVEALGAKMEDPEIMNSAEKLTTAAEAFQLKKDELDALYLRWEQLEDLVAELAEGDE